MKLSQKQKLILAIVIFIITGFVLYSTFKSDSPSVVVNSGEVTAENVFVVNKNQDIIDLSSEFERISTSMDIFRSPLFLNLKDFETILSPENSGRSNPFLPIGIDSSAVVAKPQNP